MDDGQTFPFTVKDRDLGAASRQPILPIALACNGRTIQAGGLVDSGAALNVLPYAIGEQLGAVWDDQTTPVRLTGNLSHWEARILIVSGTVGRFPPVPLAFAWSRSEDVPVILGQVNFFLEFDVCFYRAESCFRLRPKVAID